MKNLEKIKEYNFNFKNFIIELQEEFENNIGVLKKANNIDIEFSNQRIELKEIKNILRQYQDKKLTDQTISQKIVIYVGHPYLTINILLQAILGKTQTILLIDEFMLGVNTIIFSIFKKVLKKYKLENLFEYEENYHISDIKNIANKYNQIIVIGDTTTMQLLNDLNNVKFYAYNNIILYSEDDKYEKLQRLIYKYAEENEYEIEIIYDEELSDVISIINSDNFVDIVILLSENKITQELFSKIESKKIFINRNPFESKIGIIYNYFNI